jgi:hypothetical protein
MINHRYPRRRIRDAHPPFRPHKIAVHSSRLGRIIQRLFVMGGTSAYLSASQPVSPPGHLHPPAALAAPDQFCANSGLKPINF